MNKIGNMVLHGAGGQPYAFDLHTFGSDFGPVGGVYFISNRSRNPSRRGEHVLIYVGQTGKLSDCLEGHPQASCFDENGANCIAVHLDDNEASRLVKEADLINSYHTICEDQSKGEDREPQGNWPALPPISHSTDTTCRGFSD